MDVKDKPTESKDTNPNEMKLDHAGGDGRREDKGKIGVDNERLRMPTEMKIKGLRHKAIITGNFPISLGYPEYMSRQARDQRPNNRAQIIFQNEILKVCTRLEHEHCTAVASIFRT